MANVFEESVLTYMMQKLDSEALKLGKEELYKKMFNDRWNWPYITKGSDLKAFAEQQLNVRSIPSYMSAECTIKYFIKQLKRDFEAYTKEYGNADE